MTSEPQRTRRISIVVLLACLALSLICVVYPIYVIRPFRAQGARELAIALVVMRFRSAATLISGVAVLVALALYWRGAPARLRAVWARDASRLGGAPTSGGGGGLPPGPAPFLGVPGGPGGGGTSRGFRAP